MRFFHLYMFVFSFHLRSVVTEQNNVFVADTNLEATGAIYSTTTENFNLTRIPIMGIGNPFSVTFDPVEDKVYWSDSTFQRIARAPTKGGAFEVVVEVVSSEGIAIDAVSRHIFWGDADLSGIMRMSLNGTGQAVILENVEGPGGIVIDELASHIYWNNFAGIPKIERANTDGSGRFILVDDDLSVPRGLTVDFQDKRLYWCDVLRNSIESSDLLGNNRQVLIQQNETIVSLFPVGLILDHDYVYWTSWQLRHVVRLHKYGLEPPELVGDGYLEQAGDVYKRPANNIDPSCEKDCQNGALCRLLSDGSECICPTGFLGELCEIRSIDTNCTSDPCLQGGRCVQNRDSYICVCRGGYYGINCEREPYIIVANRDVGQIYSAPVTNLNAITLLLLGSEPTPEPEATPVPESEPEPVAVGFDPVENILYWTNGVDGTIHRTNGIVDDIIVAGNGPMPGVAEPFGLALNLKAGTMYWTDSQTDTVNMANMDGTNAEVIIEGGLQEPRDIEVDDAGQHIYWTDVGLAKIERANLDGSDRVLVVGNLGEPYGITIDYKDGTLYWCDALLNQIETVDLETGIRIVLAVISNPDIHPFDLILYENLVIWTDWNLPNLIQVEKTGANAGLASDGYYTRASGIQLIEGNDNSCASEPCMNQGRCRQLRLSYQCVCAEGYIGSRCETATDGSCSSNPCSNGVCTQLPRGYTCKCDQGYSGPLCETADIMFIAEQQMGAIYSAFLANIEDTFAVLPLEIPGQPTALTIDQLEGVLYWADIDTGTIGRSYLNGTGQEQFRAGLQQPSGLAINSVSRVLFCINNNNTQIEAFTLDDERDRQMILDNLNQIQDVAVDSNQGHLYWTSMGEQPKIERATQNGTERVSIVDTDLLIPTGLTLDLQESRLYWSDAGKNTIETSRLDGTGRVILTDLSQLSDIEPVNVVIYGDFMYWTDRSLQNLGIVHRYLGIANAVGPALLQRPSGLAIYTSANVLAECTEGEFACTDGFMCIPYASVCDGFVDCMDASDELPPTCLITTEQTTTEQLTTRPECRLSYADYEYDLSLWYVIPCSTGDCIAIPCNGEPECEDGSDEAPELCDFVDVRLVGELPNIGTVELYFNGQWGSICEHGWNNNDAKVICRQLGFPEGNHQAVNKYDYYYFPELSWLSEVSCIGTETNITDCLHNGWGYQDCDSVAGVVCFQDVVDVRLVGRDLPNVGNVELYFNGQWGSICSDYRWTNDDAKVICRQLGFPEGNHQALRDVVFDRVNGPTWLAEVFCTGTENNISDCPNSGWGYTDCQYDPAGVICLQDGCRISAYDGYVYLSSYFYYYYNDYDYSGPFMCDSGDCLGIPCNGEAECEDGSDEAPELCDLDVDVRLVGGTSTEGRLEVYFNGVWGTVCGVYGGRGYAEVVCRQLGYPEGNHQIVYRQFGSYGERQIWLKELNCDGSESNIGSCSHRGWGNNGYCDHNDDVGVICQGFCRQNTTTTEDGDRLSWRATSPGLTVDSIQKCPLTTFHGGFGLANRTCLSEYTESGDAIWDDPTTRDCGPEESLKIANFTKPITEGNVVEAATWLTNVTKTLEEGGASVQDVSDIADIMTTVVDVESADPEVTTSVTGICSNIVAATKATGTQEAFDNHFLAILRALEHQMSRSAVLRQQLDPVVEPNMAVTTMTVDLQQASNSGLSFAVRQTQGAEDNQFYPDNVMTSYDGTEGMGDMRTSMTLPMSLFYNANADDEAVGIGFTVHNSATLFPSNSDNGMVASDIVAANIAGIPSLNNLPDPVMIEFMAPGDNPVCVFWDFDLEDWSQEGCTLMGRSEDDLITCHCNHLTNFAVIAVPIDTQKPVFSTNITDLTLNTETSKPYATVSWMTPTAIDNSGSTTLSSNYNSGDSFMIGTTDVTYTAVDPSGNSATFTFTITVKDVEDPVISNVPETPILANTNRGKPFASVQWIEPTTSDNSQSVTITADYNPGDPFPIGDTLVTYTAIDKSGNNITAMFLVTVSDNEPPRVMSGCPVYIERFTDELSLNVSWTSPIFYDNSGMMVEQNSTDMSPLTLPLGRRVIGYHAWDPYGNIASCSITINVTAACLETSANLKKGNFTWPVSRAENQNVNSNERCDVRTEERGNGLAVRVCSFNEANGGSEWQTPEYVGCGEEDEPDLEELSETDVVENNVENVAESLNNVTQELSNPDPDDIENIADTFTNIVEVDVVTPEVTMAVVGIISNIHAATEVTENDQDVDNDDDGNMEEQMARNAPHFLEILMALEDQITRTTSLGGFGPQPLQVVEPNIALTTTQAPARGSNTGLSFVVVNNDDMDEEEEGFLDEDVFLTNNEAVPTETRTSISLPASLFNTTGNDTVGVSFFVQNSDTLFPTNSTNQTVGGDVISAIVVGIPDVRNLPEPVVLEFTAPDENPICVSWDFNISDWSEEGCWFVNYTDNDRVICHCDHLTNFAVLVDVSYERGHIILDIISKIGCGLSMVSLFATIVIFVVFRRLRTGAQSTPRKILIQMCVALFCLYLVFLVGIDQVSSRSGCIFASTLLHFFTLASLMWMGVEAYNMYLNVVKVFDAQPEHFVLKASIVAWGVPLLVSVISVGAGFHPYYDHLDYCFPTEYPLYYGIVLPVALILLHNLITFSIVMYRLCRARLGGNVTRQSQTQKMIKRLQNAFAISILMGLTWVFGFFAIGDAGFAFSLIFCLCNSLQGFVVFLLFCLRQEDVRKTLRPYFGFIGCQLADIHRSQTSSTGLSPTSKSPPKSFYSATDFTATVPPAKDTAIDNATYGMEDIKVNLPGNVPSTTKSGTDDTETSIDIEGKGEVGERPTEDKLCNEEHVVKITESSEASTAPLLNVESTSSDNAEAADNEVLQKEAVSTKLVEEEVLFPREGAGQDEVPLPQEGSEKGEVPLSQEGSKDPLYEVPSPQEESEYEVPLPQGGSDVPYEVPSPQEAAEEDIQSSTGAVANDPVEAEPFWQEMNDSDEDAFCAPIEEEDLAIGNARIERSKSSRR